MSHLHGDWVVGERTQQVREIVAGWGRVLEARRKLGEKRSDLSGRRERLDSGAEVVEVGLRDFRQQVEQWPFGVGRRLQSGLLEHLRMCELLIELQRKIKTGRRPRSPSSCDFGPRLPIKGRIDFDRIEVFGVKAQLVELICTGALRSAFWIKDAVPGPLPGWVAPARRADTYLAHAGILQSGSGAHGVGGHFSRTLR